MASMPDTRTAIIRNAKISSVPGRDQSRQFQSPLASLCRLSQLVNLGVDLRQRRFQRCAPPSVRRSLRQNVLPLQFQGLLLTFPFGAMLLGKPSVLLALKAMGQTNPGMLLSSRHLLLH
jgi:hypothetical protein